jgi:hypothetical protein
MYTLFIFYFFKCQEKNLIFRNPSVTGGDLTSVVFSVPLHGGSPDEWATGLLGVASLLPRYLFLQLDTQRCRHRVSPKITLARSPAIFPPKTEGLHLMWLFH